MPTAISYTKYSPLSHTAHFDDSNNKPPLLRVILGFLRGVKWFDTDVSKQPAWPLKMGPIGSTETGITPSNPA
jgi:hypothetical protein